MRIRNTSFIFFGLCLLAGAASAGHSGGKLFDKLDADGDGFITRAEESAMAERRFKKRDADGDGILSAEELKTRHQCKKRRWWGGGKRSCHRCHKKHHWRAGLIEKMDTDGDGNVSMAEFSANSAEMFQKADTDGDERVTREEMRAAYKRHRQERCRERSERRFEKLDADGDGWLSREEFLGRCAPKADKADAGDKGG